MSLKEQALREQICEVGRQLHRFGLVDGTGGNISARLDNGCILITPSGVSKGFMTPDHLIVINTDGQRVDTPNATNAGLKPSTETPMHLEAFKQRPDVGGVIHAHPTYAVALTIAGINMQRYIIPEAVVLLGVIPNAPYATPSSDEDGEAIRELITGHDALMLSYHGSLSVGKDPWEAYMRLEVLEHTAKLTYHVHQLGGGERLPDAQIQKLLDLRQSLGLNHQPQN